MSTHTDAAVYGQRLRRKPAGLSKRARCQEMVDTLNRITGNPGTQYKPERDAAGALVINAGCFYIDTIMPGSVRLFRLERMTDKGSKFSQTPYGHGRLTLGQFQAFMQTILDTLHLVHTSDIYTQRGNHAQQVNAIR